MASTHRYAAIDCGTNSIRLLVSEVTTTGSLKELHRDNIIVRLGQGVDATGEFAAEALERVDRALGTYTQRMVDFGVEDVMMGATSATRDAHNRDAFFQLTRKHLSRIRQGRQAQVISGREEAELSFRGAVMDLGQLNPQERVCVIDLGGGSTEFVVRTADGAVDQAFSANMGCVRLTERYLHSQPPAVQEVEAARGYVQTMLQEVSQHVDLPPVQRVVGVAGTMTTLAAITLGLGTYDSRRTHMAELSLSAFRETAREILGRTVAQRMEYGPMHPGRADVIGGGAVVVDVVSTFLLNQGVLTITVSEKDILDGMLAEVIDRAEASRPL